MLKSWVPFQAPQGSKNKTTTKNPKQKHVWHFLTCLKVPSLNFQVHNNLENSCPEFAVTTDSLAAVRGVKWG
jgi:hypothetical protein